ncbi:MAG: SDR family NAD(P)-dependent oxidoreductase [Limnohabitans sp.]|nr:SDR family NAD(P)-dependent oxidoreductase [Limnohabitans sp.]
MSIDFQGRVAIVTGAGGGLGKQHALALAKRGAKVLVNDLGGNVHGEGGSVSAAQAVVDEIISAGGEAIANGASVTDYEAVQAMVKQAMDKWGRVDILVNNAGILRDKSFSKMEISDFRLVMEVHVMGAVHCTKEPQAVVPAMLVMACEDAPNRTIMCAGAGSFEVANITLTQGVHLGMSDDAPEQLLAAMAQVKDRHGELVPGSGSGQGSLEVAKAMAAHKA